MDKATYQQQLIQLISQSGKATGAVMQAIDQAKDGDQVAALGLLAQAKDATIVAHNAQTELIQAELRGESPIVNLLAVHAQDHFMNCHLLTQLAECLIEQWAYCHELEARITKLQGAGEANDTNNS